MSSSVSATPKGWIHLALGALFTALVALPWLWVEDQDTAILPQAATDAFGLVVLLSMATLLSSYFVRWIGRRSTSSAVLTDVGVLIVLAAMTVQAVFALEDEAASWNFSESTRHNLIYFGSALLVLQVMYFLLSKLRLSIAAPLASVLLVSVGYWLQITSGLLFGAQEFSLGLGYSGALILGIVLGVVGFAKVASLLVWVLCLAIQWAAPGILQGFVALGKGTDGDWGEALTVWVEGFTGTLAHTEWMMPSVITLATAMLASVIILIVKKLKRQRY